MTDDEIKKKIKDSNDAEIVSLLEELLLLRTEVAYTTDGVAVGPEDPIYHISLATDEPIRILPWKEWYRHWVHVTKCYSTLKAAKKANTAFQQKWVTR